MKFVKEILEEYIFIKMNYIELNNILDNVHLSKCIKIRLNISEERMKIVKEIMGNEHVEIKHIQEDYYIVYTR